jgi:hypothetical protein
LGIANLNIIVVLINRRHLAKCKLKRALTLSSIRR